MSKLQLEMMTSAIQADIEQKMKNNPNYKIIPGTENHIVPLIYLDKPIKTKNKI